MRFISSLTERNDMHTLHWHTQHIKWAFKLINIQIMQMKQTNELNIYSINYTPAKCKLIRDES